MFFDQPESGDENVHEIASSQKLITIDDPGERVDLPIYVIKELQDFWPNYRKRLPFFGGHPVSITKQSCNEIFEKLNPERKSPYLVCEKTDGVRYLLIVARVTKDDAKKHARPNKEKLYGQCYLVSRQGQGRLVTYAVDMAISPDFEPATSEQEGGRRFIVSVLDGELVSERGEKPRFLIFDALIHLGRNICPEPLRRRLDCISNFLRCNEMLGSIPTQSVI